MKNAMNTAPARQMAVPTTLATLLKLLISTFSNLREPNRKKRREGVRIWAATGKVIVVSKWAGVVATILAHETNRPVMEEFSLAPVEVRKNAKCWARSNKRRKKRKENKIYIYIYLYTYKKQIVDVSLTLVRHCVSKS